MEGSRVDFGYCIGLIKGVSAAMIDYNSDPELRFLNACLPESGLSVGQTTRIVTSYLKNNPADLHESDTILVLMAFLEAYPCK